MAAFSESTSLVDSNSQALSLYIGSNPGGSAGLGKAVVITDFTMTGNGSAFEDNFATDTGPAQGPDWLADVSESVGTTIVIPVSANGPDVWVQETLPALGFDLLPAAPPFPMPIGSCSPEPTPLIPTSWANKSRARSNGDYCDPVG